MQARLLKAAQHALELQLSVGRFEGVRRVLLLPEGRVMRRNQQGIALMTVLLVMSLALLITAGMLRSHRLVLHSSAQQIHQLQMRTLAFAGESWAREHLRNLIRDPKVAVAAGQAWTSGQPQLRGIDNGQIEVDIEDPAGQQPVQPSALLGQRPCRRRTGATLVAPANPA